MRAQAYQVIVIPTDDEVDMLLARLWPEYDPQHDPQQLLKLKTDFDSAFDTSYPRRNTLNDPTIDLAKIQLLLTDRLLGILRVYSYIDEKIEGGGLRTIRGVRELIYEYLNEQGLDRRSEENKAEDKEAQGWMLDRLKESPLGRPYRLDPKAEAIIHSYICHTYTFDTSQAPIEFVDFFNTFHREKLQHRGLFEEQVTIHNTHPSSSTVHARPPSSSGRLPDLTTNSSRWTSSKVNARIHLNYYLLHALGAFPHQGSDPRLKKYILLVIKSITNNYASQPANHIPHPQAMREKTQDLLRTFVTSHYTQIQNTLLVTDQGHKLIPKLLNDAWEHFRNYCPNDQSHLLPTRPLVDSFIDAYNRLSPQERAERVFPTECKSA